MARYPESAYKYAVRSYRRDGSTVVHTKHMTKKAAEKSKTSLINGGRKGYIVKL